ncbi:MAG: phosphoglycerate dehydrogenase, partial [Chloroflexi bacterium]|nr:phosphoglycerate dehydrogenase [Chloroflexota bacterium]
MAGETVLVCSWMLQPGSAHEQYLRDHGLAVVHRVPPTGRYTEDELLTLLPGVAATVASAEPYTRRVLAGAPDLRIIARVGVGYDAIDLAAATEHGVAVTTTPGTNEKAVADFAFGLLLTVARAIPANMAAVRAGRWQRVIGPDVAGATIGIVGLGLIGKEVARRARGFDMRILAYDVQRDEAFARATGVEYRDLDDVMAGADFVTVHVPLMRQTRHVIDAGRLAKMRPTAYLINTSRGGTVDETALLAALQAGQLAGAALDVFSAEPPWGSPLLDLPNVIATPHVAGISH